MNNKATQPHVIAEAILPQLPTLSPQEQAISLEIYHLLSEASPVSLSRLAQSLDLSLTSLHDILESWTGLHYNDVRDIVGYWGLTLKPTAHQLTISGKRLFAWCAWDTLFLPALLGKTIDITSHSPQENKLVQLRVSPTAIESITPSNAMMSFLLPGRENIKQDVISNFCHYVYFFNSVEESKPWLQAHPGTFLLSIDDAFIVAQLKNQAQYRDSLKF